jgi:hypothetical protein
MASSHFQPLSSDLVGCQLKIITDKDEEIIGELFAFESGCVAIVQEPSPGVDHGRFSFRILNTSNVKSVNALKPSSESKLCESIGDMSGPFDLQRVIAIEKKALDNAVRASLHINPNASPYGRQIFVSLSKTFV